MTTEIEAFFPDADRELELVDCQPGDIVVALENGVEVWAELGALNGTPKTGKNKRPAYAMITTYLPDEDRFVSNSWRIVPATMTVVAVFESRDRRRRMKDLTRRTPRVFDDGGTVDDPMSLRKTGVF